MSPPGAIHPDTQAVLLLCGTFAQRGSPAVKPLSVGEYNAVASWLARHNRRPASLVQGGDDALPGDEANMPARERLRALLRRGFQLAAAVEAWQRLGLWVISRGEACYPERLRRHLRSSAPPLLYGVGTLDRLPHGGLAVVGSRNVNEEGLAFTRRIGQRCAEQGVQIVSGGARGVDRAGVSAALTAGGNAVAVLAEHLDRAATRSENREPLREGRLTLLTPYEPESGFTIGKAMGRNKLIYTLADFALVVRFKSNEGGTWSGAVEQLTRNQSTPPGIPVFVRAAHNPEKGCDELRRRGAILFPEDDWDTSKIVELLSRSSPPAIRQPAPAETQPIPETNTAPVSPSPPDTLETCYQRCLPLLLQQFQEERTTKQLSEIAKNLQLLAKQLEEWIKRAIAEGKLTKRKKKSRVVYVAASADTEQTLFDRDTVGLPPPEAVPDLTTTEV
jgi:predicted Rossmann fold nucleotide-binding protein DprA/Smf involved in DNA uptake